MYELWSTSSGNIIGAYETEDEALDAVRAAIAQYGDSYVDDVVLGRDDDQASYLVRSPYPAEPQRLAAGQSLADLARSRIYH